MRRNREGHAWKNKCLLVGGGGHLWKHQLLFWKINELVGEQVGDATFLCGSDSPPQEEEVRASPGEGIDGDCSFGRLLFGEKRDFRKSNAFSSKSFLGQSGIFWSDTT